MNEDKNGMSQVCSSWSWGTLKWPSEGSEAFKYWWCSSGFHTAADTLHRLLLDLSTLLTSIYDPSSVLLLNYHHLTLSYHGYRAEWRLSHFSLASFILSCVHTMTALASAATLAEQRSHSFIWRSAFISCQWSFVLKLKRVNIYTC